MIRICALSELPESGTREFFVGAGDWPLRGFVVRYQQQVFAYVNRCPHLGWQLNLKPNIFFAPHIALLQCIGHGALFDPATGQCVAGPCAGQGLQQLHIDIMDDVVCLREPFATVT